MQGSQSPGTDIERVIGPKEGTFLRGRGLIKEGGVSKGVKYKNIRKDYRTEEEF